MRLRDMGTDDVGDAERPSPPPLSESARSVFEAARAFAGSSAATTTTLRRLVLADLALARTAATQGAVLFALAALLAASAWALLTALAVWGLHAAGLNWGWSLAVPALVDLILASVASLRALKILRLADLQATRQQISMLLDDARALAANGAASPPAASTAATNAGVA